MSKETVTTPSSDVRFHGLDALRAWAMSMGLVLHAAWIMMPWDAGAPRIDASASWATDFICLSIHTFRMQLFFVLAGLFACLLLSRRGMGRFIKNRLVRIAVPMVVFWLILCPIQIHQGSLAQIQSGAVQGDVQAWELTKGFFENLSLRSTMLLHLWFLYYLFWIYVVAILLRAVAIRIDRNGNVFEAVVKGFEKLVRSPAAVFVLAIPVAVPMLWMKGPWGIEVGFGTFIPTISGVAIYGMYFGAGWLLYRCIGNLSAAIRHWKWQLAIGMLLMVPFYFYAKWVPANGYVTRAYPLMTSFDIASSDGLPDYTGFRNRLLNANADSVPGRVFQALPTAYQSFLKDHPRADQNEIAGLTKAINKHVLSSTDFADSSASMADKEQVTADSLAAIQMANRKTLESGFGGLIRPIQTEQPYYHLQRTAFVYLYCLTTWCMILGCIGFSQHYFDRESKFWRYFSDASYWFYLAHLPIQFQLLLWVGDEPWNPALKFTFYVVVTALILVPSYHFLVRPSWIGWMLSGRMQSVWPDRKKRIAPEPAITQPATSR